MGAAALPHLAAAFRRHRQSYERATPFSPAIAMIGQRDPAAQPEAVATLMALLEEHEHNALDLNATLIDGLIDLRSEHSLPLIQSAYEAGHVDNDIVTWEGVQIAFGLKEGMTDLDKYRDLLARVEQGRADGDAENVPFAEPRQARAPKSDADKIRKKKRKAEKQARKKNRRKR